ncbi:DNA polymerase III subunit epsilon, partial [Alteromonadaceae bacterium A_SAG5]|nr:DNA polymerase III subunit epsilon [Alteromonadaceae bacterium A_SAG5]
MTGGQTKLKLASSSGSDADSTAIRRIQRSANKLKVIKATADEITQHEARLDIVEKAGGKCLWRPQPEEVS